MVIKVKYDGEWVKIPYLSTVDAPVDNELYGRKNGVWSIINVPDITDLEAAVDANTIAIQGKVDKIDGKGLSTNDYTNEDKVKVDNATVYYLPTAVSTLNNTSSSEEISNAIGGLSGINDLITKIKAGVRIRLPQVTSSFTNSGIDSASVLLGQELIPVMISSDDEPNRIVSMVFFGFDVQTNSAVFAVLYIAYIASTSTFTFVRTDIV